MLKDMYEHLPICLQQYVTDYISIRAEAFHMTHTALKQDVKSMAEHVAYFRVNAPNTSTRVLHDVVMLWHKYTDRLLNFEYVFREYTGRYHLK